MNSSLFDPLIHIVDRPNEIFVRGEGSWLWDNNQKKYLDFLQGWAVTCLGHCPPEITSTLNEQAKTLINCSPALHNEPMLKLAQLIVDNSCFDQVFFANSGAEANEGAIKLARKWGLKNRNGAFEIITMNGGFHGRTLTTMSASGKEAWEQLFEPKTPGFIKVPFNNLAAIEDAINERTVGVMLELIQGEGGVIPADPEYVASLSKLCKDKNLLLIADEIQTGIGRTGSLFAYQGYEIEPDIMTLGKGLGGGVPLSALVAKKEFCCFEPGDQGGTYNGNALMTAVGHAVVQTVRQKKFLTTVNEMGRYLGQKLTEFSSRHNMGKIRGAGLLLALDIKNDNSASIVNKARQNGLLINGPGPDSLRFMPSLRVSKEEIDIMIDLLEKSV